MIIVQVFALVGYNDFLQGALSCSEFILNDLCVSFGERIMFGFDSNILSVA